jgi:Spy/CpxP family protein refolding chaperone
MTMSGSNDELRASERDRPRRRKWLAPLAMAGAFLAGGLTVGGLAVAAEGMAMHQMMGNPADMHGRAMAHVSKMLDEVGASADQKARIETILRAGFESMASLHGDMRQTHASLHAILAAPTIDRVALEQLRAGQVARFDQATRSMTQALADAAEILRPDQRAKLATLMARPHAPS